MTSQAGSTISEYLVRKLSRLRNLPLASRLALRWVRNRPVHIFEGVGAGLVINPGLSNPAYALGTNELPVQQALAELLGEGDVFYDIGANIGFFTLIGAYQVGASGKVYAFEPVPDNALRVRENIASNGFKQAVVFEVAVSDHSGEGELLLADYSGGSSLGTASIPPDLVGSMIVQLITIDEWIGQGKILPPSVVKIDVEGAEKQVLAGMQNTLRKYRPVVVYEIDDATEDAFEHKRKSIEGFLIALGYQIERLDDSYGGGDWIVGNYVAVPKFQVADTQAEEFGES